MESNPRVFRGVAERFAANAVPQREPRVNATPRAPMFADEALQGEAWCPVLPCSRPPLDRPDQS